MDKSDPEHFQRSMPEISKDVPLDPPGQFKGGVAGVSDDESHGEVVEENYVDENQVDKKKIGEPVYRGVSVFHNMEKIDDDETNQQEEGSSSGERSSSRLERFTELNSGSR